MPAKNGSKSPTCARPYNPRPKLLKYDSVSALMWPFCPAKSYSGQSECTLGKTEFDRRLLSVRLVNIDFRKVPDIFRPGAIL